MLRKCTVVGLLLVATSVVAVSAQKTFFLVDDFNDGDSEGWEETDFTGGRGTFFVSDGAYQLQTTEAIPVDDPSVGTLDADFEASEDNPLFGNGTVRGVVRANTYGTTVGFLLRDSHETESDYGFYGSTSFGTFYIERFELVAHPEAPQTILAMADPVKFPFQVGEEWNIEASVIGHKLEMKAWKVGEPEPNKPILKVQDKVLSAQSATGIAAIAFFDPVPLMLQGATDVNVSASIDDIFFAPNKK